MLEGAIDVLTGDRMQTVGQGESIFVPGGLSCDPTHAWNNGRPFLSRFFPPAPQSARTGDQVLRPDALRPGDRKRPQVDEQHLPSRVRTSVDANCDHANINHTRKGLGWPRPPSLSTS
jgi:hypothetical protein